MFRVTVALLALVLAQPGYCRNAENGKMAISVGANGEAKEESLVRSDEGHQTSEGQVQEGTRVQSSLKPHKEEESLAAADPAPTNTENNANNAANTATPEDLPSKEGNHTVVFFLGLIGFALVVAGGAYFFLVHKKLVSVPFASGADSSEAATKSEFSADSRTMTSTLKSGTSIPDSDSVSEDSSEKIAYLFNRVRTSLENLNHESKAAQQPQAAQ